MFLYTIHSIIIIIINQKKISAYLESVVSFFSATISSKMYESFDPDKAKTPPKNKEGEDGIDTSNGKARTAPPLPTCSDGVTATHC